MQVVTLLAYGCPCQAIVAAFDLDERTVRDWLVLLEAFQPEARRHTEAGAAQRTALLAVLRGAMLDLLATGDVVRTTGAVEHQLAALAR